MTRRINYFSRPAEIKIITNFLLAIILSHVFQFCLYTFLHTVEMYLSDECWKRIILTVFQCLDITYLQQSFKILYDCIKSMVKRQRYFYFSYIQLLEYKVNMMEFMLFLYGAMAQWYNQCATVFWGAGSTPAPAIVELLWLKINHSLR